MERLPDQRLQAVRDAVESVHDDPAAALAVALDALADASGQDRETTVTAEWAAGLAHRDLGALERAAQHLVRGVTMAADEGLTQLEGNIRSSLALVHAYRGHTDAALDETGRAITLLDGPDRARVEMQQALVHQRLGELARAVEGYDRALPELQAAADHVGEIRLLVNRGLAHAYRGAFDTAGEDLRRARRLAQRHGQRHLAAGSAHNLGFVLGRQGDVPGALRWFDRAAAEFRRLGVAPEVASSVLSDRAETLLRAGLTAEALSTATRALAMFDGSPNVVEEAEARLLVARAALAERDTDRASREGRRAARAFAAQHRDGWVVRAEHVVFEATEVETADRADRRAQPSDAAGRARAAVALASRLETHGWSEAGAAVRIRAAALFREVGHVDDARSALAAVPAPDAVETAAHRTLAWHARALGHVLSGQRSRALDAVARGLQVVDEYRATLSATDLRVRASGLGAGLAALGLRLAVDGDDVGAMLRAAEAWKAGNLIAGRRADAVAGLDEVLAHARAVQADLRRASADGEDTGPLRTRLVELEQQVRDSTRVAAPAPGRAAPRDEFDPAVVAGRTEGALVEYIVVDGMIHAVWFVDGVMRHARCGNLDVAISELRSARLSLHRLAHGVGTPAGLAHAGTTLATALQRLDTQLLAPLGLRNAPVLGGPLPPLVVVPTGPLHGVPWSGLPSLWDRTVTVAPSLRMWLSVPAPRGGTADGDQRRPLVVAGPGLPGAASEVRAVGSRWPDARILAGAEAGVAAVLEQLDTTSVAHIAAHGRLRADNPQFSALTLADGDLTVYDLERLDHVPPTLILSACDVGASVVHPGDELLGVAATLLARGARSVIAPSVPVPDDTTADLMVRLHEHLASGTGAAESLTRARGTLAAADHRHRAVAASFVCLGGGAMYHEGEPDL